MKNMNTFYLTITITAKTTIPLANGYSLRAKTILIGKRKTTFPKK